MTNLVNILKHVTNNDLVLIDEIGAGTDPGEGAALAMAILEQLLKIGARTVATTHYSELKAFAYSRQGVCNASVEFSLETLKPTYRLMIGIPGSSNAFAISTRLGLSPDIIQRAQELVTTEHQQLEKVMLSLEKERHEYLVRLDEVKKLQEKLLTEQEKLNSKQNDFFAKRDQILITARNEAAQTLRMTRREVEAIISELKKAAQGTEQEKQNAFAKARGRIKEGLAILSTDEPVLNSKTVDKSLLTPGTSIYITTLSQAGNIISVSNEEATVQLGIMKVNVPLTACQLIEQPSKMQHKNTPAFQNYAKAKETARQIDVRGSNVEEAETLLGKYLDDAILAGLGEILVIHGKGTGALRKGVRTYLKLHPYVRDISIGELNEGGDGATIVKLK
jgi:DNA mismatch repair protein MutS2